VTDAQREALDRVQRNQRHLLGLINDILDFSKVEAGALRLEMATLDLRDVVASLEALIGPEFERRGVAYRALPCSDPLLVRGDRERVVQVCLNLVTNALKATAPGGEVRVSCEARAGAARVDVADTGAGIPADQLEAIFSPFTQLGRALNKPGGGVGLGLAISRDLARAMGGDLTVVSEEGGGSTFTLALPPACA
jgi:signal transduction histidine kinase